MKEAGWIVLLQRRWRCSAKKRLMESLNTIEPMEVDPPESEEEPMEVDLEPDKELMEVDPPP